MKLPHPDFILIDFFSSSYSIKVPLSPLHIGNSNAASYARHF